MSSRRRPTPPKKVKFSLLDTQDLIKSEKENNSLVKHLGSYLQKQDKVQRLAFEVDPTINPQYYSVYIPKPASLIPDTAIKQITLKDGLVATIINTRANHLKSFGRPLKDRFSYGYKLEIKSHVEQILSETDKKLLKEKIVKVTKELYTCGKISGLKDLEYMTLPEFLFRTARDALSLGRFGCEVSYQLDVGSGKKVFHSFRPIDAGTMFKAAYSNEGYVQNIRESGLKMLEQLKNERIDLNKFDKQEYSWFQVINGLPVQAFTSEELLIQNCYPTNLIELYDYPLTPIDTIISEVITHINIVSHNKLYFQSGRATRGMVIIKSEDVDDGILENIRQQFNASINGVQNSWRAPVFGIGPEDDIDWKIIDQGSRDMEFQFLADNNARVIMSAFQISPDEIPGYSHLSKGTSSQALSESNSEFKLEAARDVGIRPFIMLFQDFFNSKILPLFDQELAEKCTLTFVGLDQDSPEKEATRTLQDSTLWMSLNEIYTRVEKPIIPKEIGGEIPFNTQYQQVAPLYIPFGALVEYWTGAEGASRDPSLNFYQNQFWMQYQQFLEQKKMNDHQVDLQKQQMSMQSQQQDHQQGIDKQQVAQGQQEQAPAPSEEPKIDPNSVKIDNVTSGIDQLLEMLGKSEAQLSPDRKKIIMQHKLTVKKAMDAWDQESEKVLAEILTAAANDMPDPEDGK